MKTNLIFFMGKRSFPFCNYLFGQSIILFDMCRLIPKNNYSIFILGSNVAAHSTNMLPSGVHLIQVSNPNNNKCAYLNEVKKIAQTGNPTVLISFMIHEDASAVYECALLKKSLKNISLVIALLCTAQEYVYDVLEISGLKSTQFEYVQRKNNNTKQFVKYMELMKSNNLIDKYVVNSNYALRSYLSFDMNSIINKNKIAMIANGCDIKLLFPVSKDKKEKLKSSISLPAKDMIVVFTNRFTQYKGSDIISLLLDEYDKPTGSPIFLFPINPTDNLSDLFRCLITKKHLVLSKRLRFYLDLSKYKLLMRNEECSFVNGVISQLDLKVRDLPEIYQKLFHQNMIGVVDFPIYQIADVLLRPSITDSQPLSVLEAQMCNCPIIVSNNVGYYRKLKEKEVVRYPSDLRVFNKFMNYHSKQYNQGCEAAAKEFRMKIEALRTTTDRAPNHYSWLVKHGYTSKGMVDRYLYLFDQLALKKR